MARVGFVEASGMSVSYDLLERQVRELLSDETDFIANAANFASFVYHELPDVNWAGFYFLQPTGELVLGPFAGRPACTRLAAGRGVCGAAAVTRATVVVDDVTTFSDHIACDAASRSEIVVPLFAQHEIYGVFDVDAPTPARFSAHDRAGIERLVRAFMEASPAQKGRLVHPVPAIVATDVAEHAQ
jgi:L-methionine (R)-S-oxide reductase